MLLWLIMPSDCPCALGWNVCIQFTPILYTAVYFWNRTHCGSVSYINWPILKKSTTWHCTNLSNTVKVPGMIFNVNYKEGLLQPSLLTSYVVQLSLKLGDMQEIFHNKKGFRKESRAGLHSEKRSNGAPVLLNYWKLYTLPYAFW